MMLLQELPNDENHLNRLKNFVGYKFGAWYITGRWKFKGIRNKIHWEVQCECGSPPLYKRPTDILNGRRLVRCKKCATSKRGSSSSAWRGYKDIPKQLLGTIERSCSYRSKDIKSYLTLQDLQDAWEKSGGVCAYTGWPIEIGSTASVDRIDSDKDYRRDNIQFVHKDINRMKWDSSEAYFIELCTAVAKRSGGLG